MARRRSLKAPLVALTLCAAAAWVWISPYRAVWRLHDAAKAGDEAALARMVDFPALRTSLREEIPSALGDRVARRGGGALGMLAEGATRMVSGRAVDLLVTPRGIAALLDGRDPAEAGKDGRRRDDGPDGQNDAPRVEGIVTKRGWEDASTFAVRFHDREGGDERAALLMKRQGLTWRLAAVRIAR